MGPEPVVAIAGRARKLYLAVIAPSEQSIRQLLDDVVSDDLSYSAYWLEERAHNLTVVAQAFRDEAAFIHRALEELAAINDGEA
jgi:hypothetical protein